MATYVKDNSKTCAQYIEMVKPGFGDIICQSYDFSNLEDLKYFLRPNWYGDVYKNEFLESTGLTDR
jgi:hypothetical protein